MGVESDKLRDGIFALRTRRFGTVAEIMIKKLYNLEKAETSKYDLFDKKQNKRIEVKFSTVMKTNNKPIKEDDVIEQCSEAATLTNRAMKYSERQTFKFYCNIAQVKCDCFDILYYGLFFTDKIIIFKMTSKQVAKYKGYCDKQHQKSKGVGQFHIKNDNIDEHMREYKQEKLTYDKLYKLLSQN